MTYLLLIIIYIGFIGLGLPDSLFGAAWPAIYNEFGLPLSMGSVITVITTLGTTLSSMKSAVVIKRFGTGRVALLSTLFTAIAILGISLTGSFWFICLCAIPLGLGAGSIDTALNNYVSQHYTASQMSFLHCFYGIGVTVSPLLLAHSMEGDGGWRGGYASAFWLQAGITLVLLLALPLWKRVKHSVSHEEEETQVLSLREIARIPGVKITWLMYSASVAIEMTCGAWGSTYLVEGLGMTTAQAAGMIMFYFLGIAVGRFLSGILAMKLVCMSIIRGSAVVLLAALLLLLFAHSPTQAVVALFLIGLGNGPMFPNFTYLTPQRFGNERSAAIIGTQLAVSNIAWLLMPVICSLLGEAFGMGVFPWYLALLYAMLVWSIMRFGKIQGRKVSQ